MKDIWEAATSSPWPNRGVGNRGVGASRRAFVRISAIAAAGLYTPRMSCAAGPLFPYVAIGSPLLQGVLRWAGEGLALWAFDRFLDRLLPNSRHATATRILDGVSTAISLLLLACPGCRAVVRLRRFNDFRVQAGARVIVRLIECPNCGERHECSVILDDLARALGRQSQRLHALSQTTDELAAYWRNKGGYSQSCTPRRGDIVFGWNSWWGSRAHDVFFDSEPKVDSTHLLHRLDETDLVFVFLAFVRDGERFFAELGSPRFPSEIAYTPWIPSPWGSGLWGLHGASFHLLCLDNGGKIEPG